MSPAAFIDDPRWYFFLPEVRDASSKRHLPTHEDCAQLDVESAAAHLRKGGTLGAMAGYEERPGQIAMLEAVARAFNSREHLMIEAGTGVGKSLAYLVPSILWAYLNDTPVIVSTATRNLQSQLMQSDIPRALNILGDAASKFKVALLKGRGNYLCLRALDDFFASGYWTMTKEDQEEMPHLIEWLKSTPDGDLDFYDGLSRTFLTCPGEECSKRRCPFYSRCFVYRARKAASEAHLVIVNHSLVCADAISGAGTVLPAYSRLVLDEAHNLENIATEYLSREFSMLELMRLINRLWHRPRQSKGRPGGVLAALDRAIRSGQLNNKAIGDEIALQLDNISGRLTKLVNAAENVFSQAALLLQPNMLEGVVRFDVKEGVRRHSVRGLFEAYTKEEWDEAALHKAWTRFESETASLIRFLHGLREVLIGDTEEEDVSSAAADFATQLLGLADSFVQFTNSADFILKGEKPTHAYWVERVHFEKRRPLLRLVAAPLSVAEDLRTMLYEVKDSVILSSATLRVGNDFKYTSKRLGAQERFQTLVAQSPFNYFNQSLVLAPDWLPDPAANSNACPPKLAELFSELFVLTKGRALVLFTSYEMMNATAQVCHELFKTAGLELLVQGEGLSREAMTRRLKDSTARCVVFGAQSFWEGVDVAGEALVCVVISRLPFAQVGDPIIEARSEKVTREGGSAFRDYTLPEAVIKFRQGFGRLIRTKRDRGVVIVTDPRLMTKNYGAIFRKSIPAAVHAVTDKDDLLMRAKAFLEKEIV